MEVRVLLNRKGLTLVEVMIALVVLLFVSLAMMQTALVSIDSNMKNTVRTEAVGRAEKIVNDLRNLTYTSTFTDAGLANTGSWACVDSTDPHCPTYSEESRYVRNAWIVFTEQKMIIDRGTENKEVSVKVSWNWKGDPYDYTFSTVLRKN